MHHAQSHFGAVLGLLGRHEEAVHWLTRAADEGYPSYPWFATDQSLAPLKGHAGYEALLARSRQDWERCQRSSNLRARAPSLDESNIVLFFAFPASRKRFRIDATCAMSEMFRWKGTSVMRQRANRPTPPSSAAMRASGSPANVNRTPMFISD